jgi:CubicO group peptidase (beta-lactamase class C family)
MRRMQRVLVMVGLFFLVTASLGAGVLAAHWPFWQRAWQWHVATTGWPATIDGAAQVVHGGSSALALDIRADADLATVAATASTQALLLARRDGGVKAWFAPGVDAQSMVDGRGLTAVVLAPLFAQLSAGHAGLLDRPVGAWLAEWRKEDRRGPITPRQLFWQLSGMPAGDFTPLNPFNTRAQLSAGPDFTRAALRWQPDWPPGSHFEESPVNAQLLALVAARIDGVPYTEVLQQRLWSRVAAGDALAMLDHRDGDMAAHCCLRASLGDWLRLALLLAADGRHGGTPLWPPGFLAQLATDSAVHEDYGLGFRLLSPHAEQQLLVAATAGRRLMIAPHSAAALLWIGEGEPPPGLARLLP